MSNVPTFGSNALNWRKRSERMNEQEINDVISLSEKYNKAHDFITKMNGPYRNELENLYQNLVAGQKKFGFVFQNIFENSKDKIQIAKLNPKDSNEVLTFSWLDKENKSIKKYRICRDGSIFSPSAELKRQEKFDFNIIVILNKELDKLNNIIENYNYLKKMTRKVGTESSFSDFAEEIRIGKTDRKADIDNLSNAFKMLHSKILANFKLAFPLKHEFLGETSPKSKSYTFKNIGENLETYSFTPSHLFGDGRNAMIQVIDKDNKLRRIYILYDNGTVKTTIKCENNSPELRPNNLKYVTKSSSQENEITQIISLLQENFKAFDKFVDDKISKKQYIQEVKQVKKEEVKPKAKPIISDVKKEKTPRVVKQKAIVKDTSKEKSHVILKQTEQKVVIPTQQPKNIKSPEVLKREYLSLNFSDLVESLRNIFNTPVEQRSSNLVHEKLPDGRIFGGRFSLTVQDGAKITVSQKLSKQIWNYKYYSIKVDKGNLSYTINMDYENGRFINSTKDGKILINSRNDVSYVPKIMMLERQADIVNLPQYMEEICLYDNTQPKQIIDFTMEKKVNKLAIEQREQEVERVLHQLEKEEDSLL